MVLLTDGGPCHLRAGYLVQRRFPGLISRWWIRPPPPPVTLADAGRALHTVHGWLARPGGLGDLMRVLRWHLRAGHRRDLARVLRMALQGSRGGEAPVVGHELVHLRAAAAVQPVELDAASRGTLAAELAAISPYFIVSFGHALPPGEVLRHARGLVIHAQIDCWPLDSMGASIHVVDPLTGASALARRSTVTLHADDTARRCIRASTTLATELLLDVLASACAGDELIVFPQPRGAGCGAGAEPGWSERMALDRGIASGWLANVLAAVTDF